MQQSPGADILKVRVQVAITDPEIRRGLLLLRPENVLPLGGQVTSFLPLEALTAA